MAHSLSNYGLFSEHPLPAPVAKKGPNTLYVKISVHAIEEGPPILVRVGLTCSFDANLFRFLSSLPNEDCRYCNSLKLWLVNFLLLDSILSFVEAHFLERTVDELPRFLMTGLKQYLKRAQTLPINPPLQLEPSLRDVLLDFQLEGIRFAVSRGGRALIADEMGCGKTLQAIGVLQHYRQHWPALLIVPVTLVSQWKNELTRFCKDLLSNEEDLVIVRKATDTVGGKVCIISYSIVDRLVEQRKINPEMFGMVIADESHNIKSLDAKRTERVMPFLKRAEVAICLTGTPAVNRPVELYTQLHCLLPQVFSQYDGFIRRYCDAKPMRFGSGLPHTVMDVKGSSNEVELRTLLEGLVMIRRLKADVLDPNQMPSKLRDVQYVEIDSSHVSKLNALRTQSALLDSQLKAEIQGGGGGGDPSRRARLQNQKEQVLQELYRATGVAKVKAVGQVVLRTLEEHRLQRTLCVSRKEAEMQQEAKEEEEVEVVELLEKEETVDEAGADSNARKKRRRRDFPVEGREEDRGGEERDEKGEGSVAGVSLEEPCLHDGLVDTDEEEEGRVEKKVLAITRSSSNNGEKSGKSDKGERPRKRKRSSKSPPSPPSLSSHSSLPKMKLLVFAHHQAVMDALEELLHEHHVGHVRIDGHTVSAKRTELIEAFESQPQIEVAILSITSCGTGLNLTAANRALFAELYWTPGIVLQAEDRIHRLGQTSRQVHIQYLLAKNTADDIVWEQINRKHQVLGNTIGTGDRGGRFELQSSSALSFPCDPSQTQLDQFYRVEPSHAEASTGKATSSSSSCTVSSQSTSASNLMAASTAAAGSGASIRHNDDSVYAKYLRGDNSASSVDLSAPRKEIPPVPNAPTVRSSVANSGGQVSFSSAIATSAPAQVIEPSITLTAEQLDRIARNRQEALRRQAARMAVEQSQHPSHLSQPFPSHPAATPSQYNSTPPSSSFSQTMGTAGGSRFIEMHPPAFPVGAVQKTGSPPSQATSIPPRGPKVLVSVAPLSPAQVSAPAGWSVASPPQLRITPPSGSPPRPFPPLPHAQPAAVVPRGQPTGSVGNSPPSLTGPGPLRPASQAPPRSKLEPQFLSQGYSSLVANGASYAPQNGQLHAAVAYQPLPNGPQAGHSMPRPTMPLPEKQQQEFWGAAQIPVHNHPAPSAAPSASLPSTAYRWRGGM